MFWYLLLLVPVAVGAYLLWDHRRKAAARAAASAERLNMILGATTYVPPPAKPTPTVDKVPSPPLQVNTPAPSTPGYATRERVLTPPETLLYYLLKTGLPEYHVFAHVTLRAVLDAAPGLTGYARNEHTRRLGWHAVDFLVSDRNLRPVAVIELARHEEPEETRAQRKSWIGSAGLRYLSFEPASLPRKEALRALVLGEARADETKPLSAERTAH